MELGLCNAPRRAGDLMNGKLGKAPRLSLLKNGIVEIFETQRDTVWGQRIT